MIVYKDGRMIDTCNMSNNHLYTYIISDELLYKVEVNFELYYIEKFLKRIKEFSEEKEGNVEEIEFNPFLKTPIAKHPYDEIIQFMCDPNEDVIKKDLLENKKVKGIYLHWREYPDVYYDIKKIIDFKLQPRIGQEKHIDLNYYLSELDKLGIKDEFIDILTFENKDVIEKSKLEEIIELSGNHFIDLRKAGENAKKYLDYGYKNKELIKKIR